MKFTIAATSEQGEREKYLIEKYPCLAKYGFLVKEKVNKYHTNCTIEINSLEELLELKKDIYKFNTNAQELVITQPYYNCGVEFEIEIYDGYRE